MFGAYFSSGLSEHCGGAGQFLLITLQRQEEVVAAHWVIYMRLHRNSTAKQTEIDAMIYCVLILDHPLSP